MREVLLDEHGRRREHARLLAALDAAEDRAQRDLGLAVADVAADQAIHRARRLHVGEHRVDRVGLIGRLVERERRLELAERVVGGREAMAGQGGALRVELQQLLGERADVARRPSLRVASHVTPPSLSSRGAWPSAPT